MRKSEKKNAYKSQSYWLLWERGKESQELKNIISLNISKLHEDFPYFHPSLWSALLKPVQHFLYSRES